MTRQNYVKQALAALGCCTALTGAVWAQLAPPSQDLQEIVVTAEKRESTVQKTPISITAISGADLQAQGLSDMTSVAQQVPGVSFKTSGPGQTEFEMRGLTSTGGESPTVGFYLDDAVLTPAAMAQNGKTVIDPSLFDLNRVEVLRGPQGTLYGAGSMGGTIKLVTNQPDPNAFGANVEVIGSGTTDGGGFNHTENVMLNIPLMQDVVALRLVGTDKYIDGWIDRKVVSPFPVEVNNSTARGDVAGAPVAQDFRHSNTERLQAGRASLLIQPTDRLSITAGFMHQSLTQDGPNTIDSPPLNEVHYQPFDVAEPFEDKFDLYTLTGKYNFDSFQLVSATAYWDRQQNQTQDISEAMQDYIGGFFGPPASWPFSSTGTVTEAGNTLFGLGAGTITEDDYTRQFSEELRLASTGNGPLQWLVGGYYSSFGATSHVYSFYPAHQRWLQRGFRHHQPGRQPSQGGHRSVRGVRRGVLPAAGQLQSEPRRALLPVPQQFGDQRQRRLRQRHQQPAVRPGPELGRDPEAGLGLHPGRQHDRLRHRVQGLPSGRPQLADPRSAMPVGRPHAVRSGQRVELRTGRETSLLRFACLGQRRHLLRGLDECAAAGRSQVRLQVHGQRGQGEGVRRRTRGGRGAGARLRSVAERRLHSRHELDDAAGRRRGGGTASPGCAGSHRQHELELQAAARRTARIWSRA